MTRRQIFVIVLSVILVTLTIIYFISVDINRRNSLRQASQEITNNVQVPFDDIQESFTPSNPDESEYTGTDFVLKGQETINYELAGTTYTFRSVSGKDLENAPFNLIAEESAIDSFISGNQDQSLFLETNSGNYKRVGWNTRFLGGFQLQDKVFFGFSKLNFDFSQSLVITDSQIQNYFTPTLDESGDYSIYNLVQVEPKSKDFYAILTSENTMFTQKISFFSDSNNLDSLPLFEISTVNFSTFEHPLFTTDFFEEIDSGEITKISDLDSGKELVSIKADQLELILDAIFVDTRILNKLLSYNYSDGFSNNDRNYYFFRDNSRLNIINHELTEHLKISINSEEYFFLWGGGNDGSFFALINKNGEVFEVHQNSAQVIEVARLTQSSQFKITLQGGAAAESENNISNLTLDLEKFIDNPKSQDYLVFDAEATN